MADFPDYTTNYPGQQSLQKGATTYMSGIFVLAAIAGILLLLARMRRR